MRRRASLVALMSIGLLVAGCYERVARGQESIYRFAWWLGPLVIIAGIAAFPAGWFLRKLSAKWGFVLMFMAPFVLFFTAPAMYSDRVLIDDEHFEARFGFWFSPTVHH